ncbi:MAG: thioredoxin domain-containing protein [Deltaproteobacteria bacterium]|nr:thioredoxin domain-containing protein [Deltaproteobacteria bacterium]
MSDTKKKDAPNDETSPAVSPSSMAQKIQVAIVLVSLLGLAVAIELTHIHYESHTNPDFNSICAINEALNCETVARSPWSVFAGLPISVWGMLAYTLFGILGFHALLKKKVLAGFYLVSSLGALVTSGLLAYISTFLIKSLCLFCTTLYVVNSALFILGIVLVRTSRYSPIRAIWADIQFVASRLQFYIPFSVLFALAVVLTYVLVPAYWKTSSYDSLPSMASGVTKEGHYWIGAKNPKVTIEEFSDYECPFCRRAHYNARMMVARHRDDVRLVHRHMPVDNKCNEYMDTAFHERACEFAYFVECAGEQGKFWQMNDALFGLQETTNARNVDLEELAETLLLNLEKMSECVKSAKTVQKIAADIDEGNQRQLPGTPTYFVGAQPYPGSVPERTLLKYIERAK